MNTLIPFLITTLGVLGGACIGYLIGHHRLVPDPGRPHVVQMRAHCESGGTGYLTELLFAPRAHAQAAVLVNGRQATDGCATAPGEMCQERQPVRFENGDLLSVLIAEAAE